MAARDVISVSNRGWQAVIKLVKLGRHYHIAVSGIDKDDGDDYS